MARKIWDAFLWEWMAVFLLIAGFLFQYLLYKYETKAYLISKLKYVVVPYILLSIPAIILYMSGFVNDHFWVDLAALREHSPPYQILFFYATGAHLGPLWFVPMMCLIYLCGPLLYRLGKKPQWLGWAALLSLIVMQVTERPYRDSNILLAFVHFMPLYIIGMYIFARKEDILRLLKPGGASFFGVLAAFTGLFILTVLFGQEFANLQKIALFLLLMQFFASREGNGAQTTWHKTILLTATYSFPIYLVHGYFISVVRMMPGRFETDNFLGGIGLSFVVALIVTAICIAGAWITQRLFGDKSRYLMGA